MDYINRDRNPDLDPHDRAYDCKERGAIVKRTALAAPFFSGVHAI